MSKSNRSVPAAVAAVLGLCAAALHAPHAAAQQAGRTTTSAAGEELEEVVVTGLRGSLEQSLKMKKDSISVIDTISAEDIGKFPDLNLSESLQRIPGVSLVRSDLGEGTVIDVRGLGPAFNRVEIDGMPSTGGGFNFQSIASELFQTATVAKSPNASMVEGGIGGAVLLETPKPLDHDALKVNGLLEGVTGNLVDEAAPRAFARISQNWRDAIGLSAAVSYSQTKFRTNDLSFGSWGRFNVAASEAVRASAPAEVLNAFSPRTLAYYSYTEERDNWAGTLSAQFRPSDVLDVVLSATYADSRGARHDDRPDIPIEGDSAAPTSYTIVDGAMVSAVFPNVQNRIGTSLRPASDQLLQTTLQVDWRPNDAWRISPFIGYVNRESSLELRLYSFYIPDATVAYDFASRDVPHFVSDSTDFLSNPEDFRLNLFLFDDGSLENEELSAKIDAERYFEDSQLTSVQFGTRYAYITSNQDSRYALLWRGDPIGLGAPSLAAAYITRPFELRGAPAGTPSRVLAVNTDTVEDVFMGGGDPYSHPGLQHSPTRDALMTYEIVQRTFAGYVQANAEFGRASMNFGARLVRTWVTSNGSIVNADRITPTQVDNAYTNVLPSANLRFDLSDELVLRATYAQVMERPGLSDLRPSTTIISGTRKGDRGNPQLDPYTADQADIGIEWYFHQGAVLAATAFFKKLDSLIVQSVTEEFAEFLNQDTNELTNDIITFTQPVNADSSNIDGLEVSLQTPFYFLPGALSDFGTLLNYTYTHSKTQVDDNTTTVPGVSANSYNAVLYYDNGKLSSRLSYAWRDEYLQMNPIANVAGAQRFVQPYGQLDFSASYKLTDALALNLHVLNVTREQRLENSRIPGRADELQSHLIELERRIIFGMHMSF